MDLRRFRLLSSVVGVFALAPIGAQAAARAQSEPPTSNGKIDLTIGGENEQRAGYEFSYITGLAVDAKGRIYVCDASESNIKVFSARGLFEFAIGRKGEGPAEFRGPQNIAFSSEGLLWVADNTNRRISILSPVTPSGKLVRTIPIKSTYGSTDRIHWDKSGNVMSAVLAVQSNPTLPMRAVRTFLNSAGDVVRSDTAPLTSPDSVDDWVFSANGGVARYIKPFSARRLAAFGGGGLAAYATSTVYAVRIVDSFGKQLALIKRSVSPVRMKPVDTDKFDLVRQRVAKQSRQPESALGTAPNVKPPIERMWFDEDGRLWVERSVSASDPHVADLYSQDGRWLAIRTWPSHVMLNLGAIRGNAGVGVATNSEGLESVVRLTWK